VGARRARRRRRPGGGDRLGVTGQPSASRVVRCWVVCLRPPWRAVSGTRPDHGGDGAPAGGLAGVAAARRRLVVPRAYPIAPRRQGPRCARPLRGACGVLDREPRAIG
jgi:hypothetical protein